MRTEGGRCGVSRSHPPNGSTRPRGEVRDAVSDVEHGNHVLVEQARYRAMVRTPDFGTSAARRNDGTSRSGPAEKLSARIAQLRR